MHKSYAAATLLLIASGCHGEFEIRTEPDLWRVTPRQARKLRSPILHFDYTPELSPPDSWQIHSSLAGFQALNDGDPLTFASSQDDHRRGEYILVDLGCVCRFQTVRQFHQSESGQPPRYRVDTAGEHGFPYRLQFVGTGQPGQSTAVFPRPVSARFVKITVIEDTVTPWHISELTLE
jgi:hypothetical protein